LGAARRGSVGERVKAILQIDGISRPIISSAALERVAELGRRNGLKVLRAHALKDD